MKRASRHWHVLVDESNRQTPQVLEHEHQVNRGRRHAHYWEYDRVYAELIAGGTSPLEAKVQAMRLDGRAQTTLDFDRMPHPAPELGEADVVRRLHPEVRRSLS